MIRETKPDIRSITELVRAAERRYGLTLDQKDFEFIIYASAEFLEKFIDKFLAGCLRHADDGGDFVSNVDHNIEMEKEILDLWSYYQGMKCKAKSH